MMPPRSSLPAPQLVRLVDPSEEPYEGSSVGWWTAYGGALDVSSGVIALPGPYHPTSPFHPADCPYCGVLLPADV